MAEGSIGSLFDRLKKEKSDSKKPAGSLQDLVKKAKEKQEAEKPSMPAPSMPEPVESKAEEDKVKEVMGAQAIDKDLSSFEARLMASRQKAAFSLGAASTQPAAPTAMKAVTAKPFFEQAKGVSKEPEKQGGFFAKLKKKSMPSEEKPSDEVQSLEEAKKTVVAEYGPVKIYKIEGRHLLHYTVPVPRPTAAEKAIINTIKEAATRLISISPYKIRDPEERRNVYFNQIMEILRSAKELNIPERRYSFYSESAVREMVGFGLIDDLIRDDKLEEIMVIGPRKPVFVYHREFEMMTTNIEFFNDNEIQDLVNRIARGIGRRVDISNPLLDARLPDGSRVNATFPPASVSGSSLTIRKFREDPYTIIDLINYGTLNVESAAFLWFAVDGFGVKPANILVAGGTGSGKTTLLNVLSSLIPENERVLSIEDTAELNLPLEHWIRLEARPPGLEGKGEITMDILTKNSLRMRPDRIIVGEVRHTEAATLFTAMNTGHDGCLSPETILEINGTSISIEHLFSANFEKDHAFNDGIFEVVNCSENKFIKSLDSNGRIVYSKIIEIRRKFFEGDLYSVKLSSGLSIKLTGNHPFYSIKESLIKGKEIRKTVQVRTDKIEAGQKILASVNFLMNGVNGTISFPTFSEEEVVEIVKENFNGFVYDLTVNETAFSGKVPHNFVANGVIVGNSMGTIHSNSPEETIVRVVTKPMNVPELMVGSLDLILIEHRLHDRRKGTIRRITEIAEVSGMKDGKVQLQTLFERNAAKDSLFRKGRDSAFIKKIEILTGMSKEDIEKDIAERQKVLQSIVDKGIRESHEVAKITQDWMANHRRE